MERTAKRSPWAWVPTLYFVEGLPNMAVVTLSVLMYKNLGISNEAIAFYTAWLYLPWVVKPLWSPAVDALLTKRWWIVAMQWCMAAGMAAVAFTLPLSGFFQATLASLWLLAFASSTHDIAADGFYMLALTEHEQSVFVGIRSLFYRVSMVFGNGVLVVAAGMIGYHYGGAKVGWMSVFGVLAAIFAAAGCYHTAILPRPASDHAARGEGIGSASSNLDVMSTFWHSFRAFFKKPDIGVALLFMLIYRLPEAQMVKMIAPFLLDSREEGGLGLLTEQVGLVYGTVGVCALMAGGILGGIVCGLGGLRRWLHPMAWSMSVTCLTFLYLSLVQPTAIWQVYVCVALEQLGYGFGFTAYMLYLIYFSTGPLATSHYSICTGFMALGLMVPGMWSGWLVDTFSYTVFFIFTCACCAATIGVCYIVKVPADFGLKKTR